MTTQAGARLFPPYGAAWQIYDIASATEAPSRAVMILQYVFFAWLLLGNAGATYNALRARQE